ncbi:hypothetical protein [Novosphingobium cyanobacteriorum]|uniref:Uncharacterized protein n=1 Tax=Novosphingobium cyanobacteriorum TaxID=3024215 RepID=A0ABT6CIL4_9SPHN|nr:hypothetical protein [Novosphingobium cyanobacteriorum]MDF8333763.1 hypothetical protein [Novosphingobium cyanobacteriorum]
MTDIVQRYDPAGASAPELRLWRRCARADDMQPDRALRRLWPALKTWALGANRLFQSPGELRTMMGENA